MTSRRYPPGQPAPAGTNNQIGDRDPHHESQDGDALSVADAELRKSRRLATMCTTCVFRPGNQMHLREGRLKDLVAEALAAQSFVVCHSTLPAMAPDGAKPAICRGFADRYNTQALQVIERLFGFIDVDPPEERATGPDRR